jgi:hypothetical protein
MSTGDPRPALASHLEQSFPGAAIQPIAGDASARKFYRVITSQDQRLVVMDYGGPFDGETDDVRLAQLFEAAGLPVARVLGTFGEVGCLMIEDLGDVTLEAAMTGADGRLRPEALDLLTRAVVLASRIADQGTAALARSPRHEGPALNAGRLRFEMDYFLEHYLKGLQRCTAIPDHLRGELHDLAERAASTPRKVMCHRDFHSRNLMLLPDGRLAMVDIQDARWGPDSYDLASLLRDAYVDIEENWIEPLIATYLQHLQSPPPAQEFRERFHTVSLQRMIKALGTFGYQAGTLGRSRYLTAIPRTIARLKCQVVERPENARLARCLEQAGVFSERATGA